MESNVNKKKTKIIIIAVIVSVATLAAITAISIGIYKYFGNGDKVVVETISDMDNGETVKPEQDDIDVLILDQEEVVDDKQEENQQEITEKENNAITEEEKARQEAERKRLLEEQNKKKAEEQKKQAQEYPYWLKVNYTANTVTAYKKDENGNFTIPVRAMICSTGSATPRSGVYRTPQKARWGLLIGNSWGQYCTRITGQILFHSVPYNKQSPDTLRYDYYDKLGITTSLGCIRLTVADAKWIYDNCPIGTSVEFYSSSNPGPWGKPTAMKLSGYDAPLRNWDPTDPDKNNPWNNKNQKEEEERAAKEEAEKKAAEEKAAKEAAEKKAAEEKAAKEAAEKKAAEEKAAKEAEEKNKISVPNVVGLTEDAAKKKLQDLGFKVVVKSEKKNNNIGKIIKQSIEAGSKQTKGTTVTITVAQEDKDSTKTDDTSKEIEIKDKN